MLSSSPALVSWWWWRLVVASLLWPSSCANTKWAGARGVLKWLEWYNFLEKTLEYPKPLDFKHLFDQLSPLSLKWQLVRRSCKVMGCIDKLCVLAEEGFKIRRESLGEESLPKGSLLPFPFSDLHKSDSDFELVWRCHAPNVFGTVDMEKVSRWN